MQSSEHPAPLPIVLLPGTLCDERAFAPLIARLPGRALHPILTIGANSAAALADRILAEAPPRFVLVGFSLGGIVGLQVAAKAGDRLAGLCLIGSSARPDRPHLAESRRALVEAARRRGLAAVLRESFWPRYVAPEAAGNETLWALVVAMAEALGVDAFSQQTEIIIGRADSAKLLPRLSMPVLALCGAEDALCPPLLQEEIVASVPRGTLAIIPEAGHFALLEKPGPTTDAVLAWLDRLGQTRRSQAEPSKETP